MIVYFLLLLSQLSLAEELTLYYTTDILTKPTLIVEHHGTVESHPMRALKKEDGHTVWYSQWKQEDSLLFQLHLKHDENSPALSTLCFGRKNTQTLYILNDRHTGRQQYTSTSGTVTQVEQNENYWLFERWFWLIGCITLVLLLKGVSAKSLPKLSVRWESPLVTLCVFTMLSICWQRSVFYTSGLPAKYHDALGSFWLISQAMQWDGFFDSLSGFPIGSDYSALDSYLLWFVSIVFRFVPPLFLYKSWLILGPALSGWAASFWARDWGAKAPWTWIAGLGFGFSGLMANAILEGQIYQTMLVWLPLTGCVWWRFLSGMGSVYLIFTAVFTSLCLLSSSYIGASCLLLLVGLWLGGQGWKRPLSFTLPILLTPLFALQYHLMTASGMHISKLSTKMSIGSINLMNFWGSTPEMHREGHAIALGILFVPIVLALQLRHAEVKEHPWRPLVLTGILSIIIGFGPSLNLSNTTMIFSLPTAWLLELPTFSSLGFPIRLAQPFLLVSSIIGAVVLSRIVQRRRWMALMLPLGIAEVLFDDLSETQDFWTIASPSDLSTEESGVFTLTPLTPPQYKGTDAEMNLYMLECLGQTMHQRPIVNNCLSTNIAESERNGLQQTLLQRIISNQPIFPLLQEKQVEHLIYYPETFNPNDRRRVERVLNTQGERIAEGTTPLAFQIYRAASKADITSKEQDAISSVSFTIITTHSYPEPLQILGNGIFVETRPERRQQDIIHQATVTNRTGDFDILLQTQDGKKIWEGIIHPNPTSDTIVIRAESGPQIELPLLDSPSIRPSSKRWIMMLWGTLFFYGIVSFIRIRIPQPRETKENR